MPATIEINDHGQAVLLIPDAAGECRPYRWKIVPPGFSLWALTLTRTDTDASYRVTEEGPGRWTCECPAEKYRKRGTPHCKHQEAARALRAWLTTFLEENTHERIPTTV